MSDAAVDWAPTHRSVHRVLYKSDSSGSWEIHGPNPIKSLSRVGRFVAFALALASVALVLTFAFGSPAFLLLSAILVAAASAALKYGEYVTRNRRTGTWKPLANERPTR